MRSILIGLLLCVVPFPGGVSAAGVSGAAGTITGEVIYTADAARPWRYARYYVKDRKAGQLAEAVIALRGTPLRDWPAAKVPQSATMDQLNFQFVPETLAIREGDSVTFTNSDSTTHNVKCSTSIATFNVNMGTDGDYTHRFRRAGGLRNPVQLGCIYHGGMRAWIYVFDHPYFQVTKADGAFRFENVPPGEYTLEMIHAAGELKWKQKITVTASKAVHVSINVAPDDKTLR